MGQNGHWRAEGYLLTIREEAGFFRVCAFSKTGPLVARADFKYHTTMTGWTEITGDKTKLEVCTVEVQEDHRRKGLASAMYDLVEEYTGAKVLNGIGTISQSPDAQAFWKNRSK